MWPWPFARRWRFNIPSRWYRDERGEERKREEVFQRKYVAALLRFIEARGCKGNRFRGEKTRTTSRARDMNAEQSSVLPDDESQHALRIRTCALRATEKLSYRYQEVFPSRLFKQKGKVYHASVSRIKSVAKWSIT